MIIDNSPRAFMPRALVTYCRVSTKAQGRSGLGLEATPLAVTSHTLSAGTDWCLGSVFAHCTVALGDVVRSV